jgi:23S rRNA (adenine2503-C2)-methyltransferase
VNLKNVFYLYSGRVFLLDSNGYTIECTEMRDVATDGKQHLEVRESNDPHVIWRHLVEYKKKWLLTVSTQKGCTHNCLFCDVAKLPFKGNLSQDEIENQIKFLLRNTDYVKECDKVKIGFARMGEPAHNLENVLNTIKRLPEISKEQDKTFNWLPCFNTILPTQCKYNPLEVLDNVIEVKEKYYNGFLHTQISCNTTCEETRSKLFGGASVLDLESIITYVKKQNITNRTITLNFIVMKDVEVDVNKLKAMGLNGDRFTVKLIPLNRTNNGVGNNLETYANYKNYEKLIQLKEEFIQAGVPTVVDAIAKCEEAGLCCGQLAQIHQ